jgi:hypothetical protein
MATQILTEAQTKHVLYELGCAMRDAELHADAFHWISMLIGAIKRDDGNREQLLELAHHLADDWDERARADSERCDRAVAAVEATA